jgi:hypothetical protein
MPSHLSMMTDGKEKQMRKRQLPRWRLLMRKRKLDFSVVLTQNKTALH